MNFSAATQKATQLLASGETYLKWKDLCTEHGGDLDLVPFSKNTRLVLAQENGFMKKMDTEKIGLAGIVLKAGRQRTTDTIVPSAGIEFHAKIGDSIKIGDPIYTLHGDNGLDIDSAVEILKASYTLTEQSIDRLPLVLKVLSEEKA
jgi:pyrimidine-nucleoside phosphorylase